MCVPEAFSFSYKCSNSSVYICIIRFDSLIESKKREIASKIERKIHQLIYWYQLIIKQSSNDILQSG